VTDVMGIRREPYMPPVEGVAGQLIVSFFPADGARGKKNEFSDWKGMGDWPVSYTHLTLPTICSV